MISVEDARSSPRAADRPARPRAVVRLLRRLAAGARLPGLPLLLLAGPGPALGHRAAGRRAVAALADLVRRGLVGRVAAGAARGLAGGLAGSDRVGAGRQAERAEKGQSSDGVLTLRHGSVPPLQFKPQRGRH